MSIYENDFSIDATRKENEKLINEFGQWLENQKLSNNMIRRHINNIWFFIDSFLLNEEVCEAKEGIYYVGTFLGYWFIKRAMFADVKRIKSYGVSFKKFYTFMQQKGLVSKEDLEGLKESIKLEMPDWCEIMERYDNPRIAFDDVWRV